MTQAILQRALFFLIFSLFSHLSLAQLSTRSSWIDLKDSDRTAAFAFAEDFKAFMAVAKTELTTVKEIVALAEKNGFKPLTENSAWRPGAKYYAVNRDRTICLVVAGKSKMRDGVRLIGSHIDSPRLDLKARPLYEREQYALFQTIYHGGIKKYQWVNVPLALMGRIDKTDGTTTWVNVGNKPGEPVFVIPDLAPHVDQDNRGRPASDAIRGEELDPIAGSVPDNLGSVQEQVMRYLENTYKMTLADFVSAELQLVPATPPADVGVDRGLVGAFGQDDRLCSYVAARASFAVADPPFTTISFLVDNEESGSNNNTGANSDYLRGLMGRLLHLEMNGQESEYHLRQIMPKTLVLSADVGHGVNPIYPIDEMTNTARLGYGVIIKRYGQGNDPNSEFTARVRRILEDAKIPWQTYTYKVEAGGGGTIGGFLSRDNMEVLDCGVPILSMHSTFDLCSKIDLWWLYRAFEAFYRQ